MKAELKGRNLVCTVPVETPTRSLSGKTLVVASSRGVRQSKVEIDGKAVHWIVNAFIYPAPRRRRATKAGAKPKKRN